MKIAWNVLVIEDDDVVFFAVDHQLRKTLNIEAITRASCLADLNRIIHIPWDLIISDYCILDIGKYALLRLIADAWPLSPFVIISESACQFNPSEFPNLVAVLNRNDLSAFVKALHSLHRWHIQKIAYGAIEKTAIEALGVNG